MNKQICIWLKENWFKTGLLIILVIIMVGIFYWFEWRPTQIRKGCDKASFYMVNQRDKFYNNCLRGYGLEK